MADAVEIFLVLRNARKFIEDATNSSKAIGRVGTEAEESGKKAHLGWKGIAKWAGGAAVMYGAARAIKSAVGATTDLAKSTAGLQRVTNMDTTTASAWVGVLKERNISSQQFGRSMATFSKQVEVSRLATKNHTVEMAKLNQQYKAIELIGGKKAPAALAKVQAKMDSLNTKTAKARSLMKELGASTLDIGKGRTQQLLLQTADALKNMHNHVQRTALVQKLFGRAGQQLLPVLLKGRDGIQELIDTQVKYGNVLHGKSIKDTLKFIQQQRDLHAASEGLKVTLGTALMPAIIGIVGAIVKLVNVFQPLLRTGWFVKAMIGALIIAFIAYKAAVVAATIVSWGLSAATWASIGIWVAVVAAIIAVAVGVYVLYKKWKWFHNFINDSWAWIKKNWPLLLGILTGPFGLAAAYIITHWTQVKKFVLGVIDAIVKAFHKVLDIGKNVVKGATGIFKKLPGGHAALSVAHHLLPHFASGGTMLRAGQAIVGERGPELLSLPGGATVTPMQTGPFTLPGGAGATTITVPVYLETRMIAQAVAQYSADRLARR